MLLVSVLDRCVMAKREKKERDSTVGPGMDSVFF